MISFIFAIVFIIVFLLLFIAGGNYYLRSILENIINGNNSNEHFSNIDKELNNMDECKMIDENNQNHLNFQTTTNIPLSPNNYKNYIGAIYIDNNANENANNFPNDGIQNGKYCMNKPRLLYDGIWDPTISINSPYEHETWKLTDGNLSGGYYCSDKMIETNKILPKNFIDKSQDVQNKGNYYYMYFNDSQNDVFDTELSCFPEIFNAGMTPTTKNNTAYGPPNQF